MARHIHGLERHGQCIHGKVLKPIVDQPAAMTLVKAWPMRRADPYRTQSFTPLVRVHTCK
jgi:hypothetical protein